MKALALSTLLLFVSSTALAQPASEFKTFAEAKAEAEKWLAQREFFKADPAIKRVVELAKTPAEKADAALMYAPRVRWDSYEAGGYKRYYKFNEAYQLYQDAMKLPGLPAGKGEELRLAAADLVAQAAKEAGSPSFVDRIKNETGKSLLDFARSEFAALIGGASVPASVKARAYISRSKTYDTQITFGNIKKDEVMAAFNDLKTAGELTTAPDEDRANAYFEILEIAQRLSDANTMGGALEAITKLPAAKPDQKIRAYTGLIELLLANNMIKASREQLAAANKMIGLSNDQKAKLARLAALVYMTDVDPSDPSAAAKGKKAAIAELDKTVAVPKMTDDEKFKIYLATGEYLQNMRVAYALAVDQLQKAVMLPKVSEEKKAEAQYAIGETYRINGKFAEAKAEYLKVSRANPRYSGYAESRIKEIDAASGAKPAQ